MCSLYSHYEKILVNPETFDASTWFRRAHPKDRLWLPAFLLSLIYKTEQSSSILECPVLENSHVNCQAQSKPQLQLSWTEMVLISQLTGTTHPPTHHPG